MTLPLKLEALHARLSSQQRTLLLQAAEAGVLPPFGALNTIASLEHTIEAVDAMLDEHDPPPPPPPKAARPPAPAAPPAPRAAPPAPKPEMHGATGTVKWFNPTKGFGFIQPDTGGPDAFVHISAVERSGLSELKEGQKVGYELVADKRSGKQTADRLKIIG